MGLRSLLRTTHPFPMFTGRSGSPCGRPWRLPLGCMGGGSGRFGWLWWIWPSVRFGCHWCCLGGGCQVSSGCARLVHPFACMWSVALTIATSSLQPALPGFSSRSKPCIGFWGTCTQTCRASCLPMNRLIWPRWPILTSRAGPRSRLSLLN